MKKEQGKSNNIDQKQRKQYKHQQENNILSDRRIIKRVRTKISRQHYFS